MRLKRFVKTMYELRLDSMAERYQSISKAPDYIERSADSVLQEIVEAQWNDVHQRRIDRALAKSNIPCLSAHRQAIDFTQSRRLNRDYFLRILDCEWVVSKHNLVFTGAAQSGKKYLSSVVVREALSLGYSASCYNVSELLELLMFKRQQPIRGTKTELMKFRYTLQ